MTNNNNYVSDFPDSDVGFKTNFKVRAADTKCRRCEREEETQEHLLYCPALSDHCLVQGVPLYNDILEENTTKIATITRILSERYQSFILSATAAVL